MLRKVVNFKHYRHRRIKSRDSASAKILACGKSQAVRTTLKRMFGREQIRNPSISISYTFAKHTPNACLQSLKYRRNTACGLAERRI